MSRRPTQQAGELEAEDRASSPSSSSTGTGAGVRQLPCEGAQMEHDQGGEPDIFGAVETDRHGS